MGDRTGNSFFTAPSVPNEISEIISLLKGQIKAKYFFIDFYNLQSGDFKISNEISI